MVAGLLLAAGSGSRMGQPKAQIEINGVRLVDLAVSRFLEAGISEVYVVLGAWVGEVPHAHVLVNSDWQEGMGSSLRCGLHAIENEAELKGIDSVLVSLVDLPGVTSAALSRIANEPHELVMGTYNGKKGHPVKFARNHWAGIIESAQGDVGARTYLATQSGVEYIALEDLATGNDLDFPADLVQFRS